MPLYEVLSGVKEELSSPIFSGFFSSIIRSTPYEDYSELEEVKMATLQKEIDAAVQIDHPVELDFKPIFSSNYRDRSRQLAPNLPPNPVVAAEIHSGFIRARRILASKTLYPKCNRKTVAEETQKEMKLAILEGNLAALHDFEGSTRCMEAIYSRCGTVVGGYTEMRSAWMYSQMKPRVYYARSGEVYYASRYIQTIFNVILDEFPFVHRHNRFTEPDGYLDEEDAAFIYDYTSFTSSMEEIKRFISALADFMRGTEVRLLDSWKGYITADLRELLDDYNRISLLAKLGYLQVERVWASYSIDFLGPERFVDAMYSKLPLSVRVRCVDTLPTWCYPMQPDT
jgi:hypothetical protein